MVDEFERSSNLDVLRQRVLRASETRAGGRDYRASRECLVRAHAAAVEGHSAYDKLVCAFLKHESSLQPCAVYLAERIVTSEATVSSDVFAEMNVVKELRQRAKDGHALAADLVAGWSVKEAVKFAVKMTSGKECQEIGGSGGWESGRLRRGFGSGGGFGADDDDVSSDGEDTTRNGYRGHAVSERSRGWLATSTGVVSRHVAMRDSKTVAEDLRRGKAKELRRSSRAGERKR